MSSPRHPRPMAAHALPAALLVAAALLGACATVRPTPPLDHLAFDLGEGSWEPARQEEDRRHASTEMVRSGESLDDWHELFTVQTFDRRQGAVGAPTTMAAALRAELRSRCPGAEWRELAADSTGTLYESRVSGCAGEADRQELVRIVRGTDLQAYLAYTVRGTMSDSLRAEWLARLNNAAFYRTVAGR